MEGSNTETCIQCGVEFPAVDIENTCERCVATSEKVDVLERILTEVRRWVEDSHLWTDEPTWSVLYRHVALLGQRTDEFREYIQDELKKIQEKEAGGEPR